MLEVEIRNFQSIEKAAICIESFSVLVGRSNIGKSSIVRAIKAALTGAPVASFVRHGPECLRTLRGVKTCKCFASVHIKANGLDLFWEKGDSVNRYTINGQLYDKADRGVIEPLREFFSTIKVGDRVELLQVADQFSPIFLLDQSGSVVADVLGDVAKLERINVALQLAEKDRREASSTRKVREKDIVVLNQRLQTFSGLEDIARGVEAISEHLKGIEATQGSLTRLQGFLESGMALGKRIRALDGVTQVLPPESSTLTSRQNPYNALGQFLQLFQLKTLDVKGLAWVDEVSPPDDTELQTKFDAYASARQLTTRFRDKLLGLKSLSGVEALKGLDSSGLSEKQRTHEKLCNWVTGLGSLWQWKLKADSVEKLALAGEGDIPRVLNSLDLVAGLYTRYTTFSASCVSLEKDSLLAEGEAAAIQAEWDALGVCPTCSRTLGAKHVATNCLPVSDGRTSHGSEANIVEG